MPGGLENEFVITNERYLFFAGIKDGKGDLFERIAGGDLPQTIIRTEIPIIQNWNVLILIAVDSNVAPSLKLRGMLWYLF